MSKFPIESTRSHILHHLFRQKEPVRVGDLKYKTISSGFTYEEIISPLFYGGYVGLQGELVVISPEGEQYMRNAEKEEMEKMQQLIFEDEFDLAVLGLLDYRGTWVSIEDLPQFLKDHAPRYCGSINNGPLIDTLFKLGNMGYVKEHYVGWYEVTDSGKAYYDYKVRKFEMQNKSENIVSVREVANMTINHIQGNHNQVGSSGALMNIGSEEDPVAKELARKQLTDFPKQRWNRRWITILTILGLLLAALGLYLGLG